MPQELFRVHNWRTDVETLGEFGGIRQREFVGTTLARQIRSNRLRNEAGSPVPGQD